MLDPQTAGFLSGADGQPDAACPHPPGAPERGAWLLGWVLAKAWGAMLVRVEAHDG